MYKTCGREMSTGVAIMPQFPGLAKLWREDTATTLELTGDGTQRIERTTRVRPALGRCTALPDRSHRFLGKTYCAGWNVRLRKNMLEGTTHIKGVDCPWHRSPTLLMVTLRNHFQPRYYIKTKQQRRHRQ